MKEIVIPLYACIFVNAVVLSGRARVVNRPFFLRKPACAGEAAVAYVAKASRLEAAIVCTYVAIIAMASALWICLERDDS